MRERLGLFLLGNQGYAVPLERLLRVVDQGRAIALPLVPAGVAGMLVLDGEVLPLLDSDWLPPVPAGLALNAPFRVLVATEYGPLAFPAELTSGIVSRSKGEVQPSDGESAAYLPECFRFRDGRYLVLDIDRYIMSLIRS